MQCMVVSETSSAFIKTERNSMEKEESDTTQNKQALKPLEKLFGKNFTKTSKYVVANKLWMHTVPTKDCEVMMTFPARTEDETLMWLLSRLRARVPQLAVNLRQHSHSGVYAFYLTATYPNLLRGADELGLRKKVKEEYGGGLKEFSCDEDSIYQDVENEAVFFSSQERQEIVKNMLFNFRAEDGDVLNTIKFLEGQVIVPILLSKKVVSQIMPLHCSSDLDELKNTWVKAFFSKQPLDDICTYFGVKIGIYFAWLGHYTKALILPAFFGLFLWLMTGADQRSKDWAFVVFSIFNIVWATLYLESWRRKSAELAFTWGTLDTKNDLITEPRPLFYGDLRTSPVSGKLEPFYPAWKRNIFRYLVTMPVIIFCIFIMFICMTSCFELQEYIIWKIKEEKFPSFLKVIPSIMLALIVTIGEDIYKRIAHKLNDLENYRTDETYDNNLIAKLFVVQFLNQFLSLFYLAFYLRDMDRLCDQLVALLITRQVIGNLKEALIPLVKEKLKVWQMSYKMAENSIALSEESHSEKITEETLAEKEEKSEDGLEGSKSAAKKPFEQSSLSQAEIEAAKQKYEDTFDDYLEMVIQFGYVILFSSAFPMAALCSLANNLVEIRSDAFKLCMGLQRPFGQRVKGIGIWQDCMEIMGIIAVAVNCALLGVFGHIQRFFPSLDTAGIVLVVILSEHLALVIKFFISYAIPNLPYWVATEMAKLEYNRRQALKKLELTVMQQGGGKNSDQSKDVSKPSQTAEKEDGSGEPGKALDIVVSSTKSADDIMFLPSGTTGNAVKDHVAKPLQAKKVD